GCEMRNDPDGQGVLISKGSTSAAVDYNQILNCSIHNNGGTSNFDHAIYSETNYNTFSGNRIYNNGGYGIHIYSSSASTGSTTHCSHNVVSGNIVYGQKSRSGIVVAYGTANQVYNNLVYGNSDGGIYTYGTTNIQILNNT